MKAPVGSACRCGGTYIEYRGTTKCNRCGTFETEVEEPRTPEQQEVVGAFLLLYSDMVDLHQFQAVKVVGAADLVATRVRQFRELNERLMAPVAEPRPSLIDNWREEARRPVAEPRKKGRFDLFPELTAPEYGSWADIQNLALYEPLAQRVVSMVEHGHMTREQALVALAFALYEVKRQFFNLAVKTAMSAPVK